MTVTREILKRYIDLKTEEQRLKSRCESLSAQINNLETGSRIVSDTVTCGKKGKKALRTVKIQGVDQRPQERIAKKRAALYKYRAMLDELDMEILDTITACEEFIETTEDPLMREIMRTRFVEGRTWKQTAQELNTTEDSIKKAFERFMEGDNDSQRVDRTEHDDN